MQQVFSSMPRLHCSLCERLGRLGGATPDMGGTPDRPDASRRWFSGTLLAGGLGLAVPVLARDGGVDVGKQSSFSKLVSAEQVEQAATQQYAQLLQEARSKNALVPAGDAQTERLRAIAQRIIPFTADWNPRAAQWKWEVNLLANKQINAFCMPGGKIAFFTGLVQQLELTDDEVAMVMGHEVAHALREHARERMGKSAATGLGLELGAALLGLGDGGRTLAGIGGQLLQLKFGRDDESEADLVGMELAARAGYDPRSGVSLWTKMGRATGGGGGGGNKLAEYGSTHPQGPTRIRDIEANLPKVMPLYERAAKPTRRWDSGLSDSGDRARRPATPARSEAR